MAQVSFGARKASGGGGGGKIIVVVIIIAAIIGLVYNKQIMAALKPTPPPVAKPPAPKLAPGEVWTFVSADKIPAYVVRVTQNMYRKIPTKAADVEGRDVITKESDIFGRVPIVEIEPNTELREKQLAKKGTMPGLAAGIEPGWVARTFDLAEVEGQLDDLKVNNYVAILSAHKDRPSELVSERAKVLVPMKKTITRDPPSKASPSPKKKTEGTVTVCYPAQDSLPVAEAVSRGKIQILLMSSIQGSEKMYEFIRPIQPGMTNGPGGAGTVSSALDVETIRGTKRAWEKVNYATDSQ